MFTRLHWIVRWSYQQRRNKFRQNAFSWCWLFFLHEWLFVRQLICLTLVPSQITLLHALTCILFLKWTYVSKMIMLSWVKNLRVRPSRLSVRNVRSLIIKYNMLEILICFDVWQLVISVNFLNLADRNFVFITMTSFNLSHTCYSPISLRDTIHLAHVVYLKVSPICSQISSLVPVSLSFPSRVLKTGLVRTVTHTDDQIWTNSTHSHSKDIRCKPLTIEVYS